MSIKHTPGKWINGYGNGLTGPTTPSACGPCCGKDRKFIPVSKEMETIAIVIQQENNSIEEMKANAELIAAAPELLESLLELLDLFYEVKPEYYKERKFNRALRAIRKATE